VIFQRKKIVFGSVKVHLMTFTDFDPTDYLDQLTDIEIERFYTFTNIQRQREFVATRILRSELVGIKLIKYNLVGAPYIEDEAFLSISHSKNIVGIALCDEFKIGLDIEPINDRILKVKHKFISLDENEKLDCESATILTKIWSGKESLYKISGIKSVNFRTELSLIKKEEEKWEGFFDNKEYSKRTELSIFELDNRIISINTCICE